MNCKGDTVHVAKHPKCPEPFANSLASLNPLLVQDLPLILKSVFWEEMHVCNYKIGIKNIFPLFYAHEAILYTR